LVRQRDAFGSPKRRFWFAKETLLVGLNLILGRPKRRFWFALNGAAKYFAKKFILALEVWPQRLYNINVGDKDKRLTRGSNVLL
jgi:hypothetical protein